MTLGVMVSPASSPSQETPPAEQQERIVKLLVGEVVVSPDGLSIRLRLNGLNSLVAELQGDGPPAPGTDAQTVDVRVPMEFKVRGGRNPQRERKTVEKVASPADRVPSRAVRAGRAELLKPLCGCGLTTRPAATSQRAVNGQRAFRKDTLTGGGVTASEVFTFASPVVSP